MGALEKTITLEGMGKSKQEAFADAMGKIQSTLAGEKDGYIIRIEPLAVDFLEGKEYISYERFLFLFLKRKVSKFTVKINVRVRYFFVAENCPYEEIHVRAKFFNAKSETILKQH